MKFGREFQKYLLKQGKMSGVIAMASDKAGLLHLILFVLGLVVQFMFLPIIVFYSELPLLLTSIVDLPLHWHIPFTIFQDVMIMQYIFTWFGIMYLHGLPAVEYVYAVLEIMDELELGKKTYKTSGNLRTPSNFMKLYRELQILNANAMNIYAPVVLPATQWLFSMWILYCIYGFLKLSGPFAFITFVSAMALVIFLLVLFTILAEVEVRTRTVLASWAGQGQSKILETYLRSCKSIRISIRTFYYVDHGMVLTMLKFITEFTVNLIVVE
ncbi:unnamed protein product [Allacma fusca]|uniref:Uncharacterized protein n=1 Tax=Allacma fusca TaxID=39272 RepID=A0A8J2KXJ8_9HEXA|nr:unnamed protein product [Allacma fusca]